MFGARNFFLTAARAVIDPLFDYVTLLLTGNGTNGAQNNTFLDSSTNNFTITRNGNTTQGTFTPYGSNWGVYFGGSAYLNVGSTRFLDASAWTVEMWVNTTSTANFVTLAAQYVSTGGQFSQRTVLAINSSSGTVCIFQGGTAQSGTTNVADGKWHHIAFVLSSGTVKAYVDGINEATFSGFGAPATVTTTFFYDSFNSSSYYTGYASNLRVTNTAVYTANFTVATVPLTAITGTQLLTCQSNRFVDNSANAYTVTVNGSPSVQRFSPFNPTTPYAAGTIGGSGYFDGSGDYLSVPSNAALSFSGNYTLEAFVYLTAVPGASGAEVIAKHLSSVDGWYSLRVLNNRTVEFRVWDAGNASNAVTSVAAIPLNAWAHIAGGRNGSTIFACLDGVYSSSALTITPKTSNNIVTIGMNNDGSTFPLTGYIASARAVSSAVYTGNYTVPTAPLTAITNTQLLCSFTNGGIIDNAMMNDLETVGNAQISTSVSKFGGGSMAFDGSGDYLVSAATNLPFTFNTGDFTIECWLYPASVSGGTITIVSNRFDAGADTVLIFAFGTTNGLFFHTQATAVLNSGTNLTANTWQHVALCRASGTVRIFLNGTQVGSSVSSTQNLSATASVFVGQDGTKSAGAAAQYNGYIDDLRVSKYARYTANFTPPTEAFPLQ